MSAPDSVPLSADLIDRVAARVRERLAAEAIPAVAPPSYDSLHAAAAVLAWFDPGSLRPLSGTAGSSAVEELLAHAEPVVQADGTSRWTLSAGIRVAVLRQLREQDLVPAALAANPDRPAGPLQRALDGYLTGKGTPVEKQSLVQLDATYQACEWLRAAGFADLPDPDRIVRRIDWLTLLQPFEHITGEHFRGRARELATMRSYVDVLPSETAGEAIGRYVRRGLQRDRPPLLVYGPGGVGKSALLARFILDHAAGSERDRYPFIYLDFDRPDVVASEPLTLLVEAVRQLGIEFPEARERCELIRREWLNLLARDSASDRGSGRRFADTERFRSSAIYDFGSLIDSLGAGDRPVLFVLDTFEEVQWRSREYVKAIWRLLDQMREVIDRLRVCVSGRSEIPGLATIGLPLSGLDEEASAGYLQERGVTDPRVARRIGRQVGGNPLSLNLAAELFARQDRKGGRLDIDTRDYLFMRVSDGVIQRQLYQRILGHIHNEDVQRLAHPGLVLRRITPELILHVLAGPCGLDIHSEADARALFAELAREVALVTAVSHGVLEQRQDLRRLMLVLLEQDDPRKVRAIRELAVGWYEARPASAANRAEEIYYRLSLGQDQTLIDSRWLPGVEQHLVSALPEFHGARRAYLASRLRLEVDEETLRQADVEDWERLAERTARDLLAQDRPEEALSLLRQRSDRSEASPVVGLEATALAMLGRWAEGLEVLDRGIQAALAADTRRQVRRLTLQQTELVLGWSAVARLGEQAWQGPAERLDQLSKIALAPSDRLNLVAHQIALGREIPSLGIDIAALAGQLRRTFDELPDETLIECPDSDHWAASVFQGSQDAGRMARVFRLAGWLRSDEPALRQAGAAIARLDAQVSADRGENPGVLAREYGIAARDGLTSAWSDFLLTASDRVARDVLGRLLEENAELAAGVVDALAVVLSSALGAWTRTPDAPLAVTVPAERRSTTPSRAGKQVLLDIVEALVSLYPSADSMRALLRGGLGRSYDAIVASGASPRDSVLAVADSADREGWLADLVIAARDEHPANLDLARAAVQLGLIAPEPDDSGFEDSPPGSPAARFAAGVETTTHQVGLVADGDRPLGTACLVGADLVLTADHVLGTQPATTAGLNIWFDITTEGSDRFALSGQRYLLGDVLCRSTQLDYALARVHGSPGVQPLGGWTGPNAPLRRWVDASHAPVITLGSSLTILGYAADNGPTLYVGRGPLVALTDDTVGYEVSTYPGSSGAPCFTQDWQLAALHTGGGTQGGVNVGVRLSAVLRDLDEHGFGDLLGEGFV